MNLNLVKLAFLFNTLSAGFGGILINFFESYLPSSFSKLYRHGKFCVNVKDVYLDKCEVPKRWFKHFYVFAGPLCTLTLILLFQRYYLMIKLPDIVLQVLNFFLGLPQQNFVPVENVILAMSIFTIHCWKRFYESHYISVYSDVRMNVLVYFIGVFHYFGTVISIIGESHDIMRDTTIHLNWNRLTALDYISTILFLLSTYLQYRANVILANLRRDKNGIVVTKKYKIPEGELFNFVTAPLQLTEIILYLCLTVILRNASTFYFVTLWVIVNQMECAYLSHQWSLRTLKNYPKTRKIIIPFLF